MLALLIGERAEAAVADRVAREALTDAQDGGGEPLALARLVGQIGTAIFRTGRGDRWTDGLRYRGAGRTAGPHMACGH